MTFIPGRVPPAMAGKVCRLLDVGGAADDADVAADCGFQVRRASVSADYAIAKRLPGNRTIRSQHQVFV